MTEDRTNQRIRDFSHLQCRVVINGRGDEKVMRLDPASIINDERRAWRKKTRGRIRVPEGYPYRIRKL